MRRIQTIIMIFLVVAASLPKRWGFGNTSLSVFDFIILAGFLFLVVENGLSIVNSRCRRLDVADRKFFLLLTVPLVVVLLSISWSVVKFRTIETAVKYLLAVLAFLLPVNLMRGKSLRFAKHLWTIFSCGLILGPLGFYLHLPGFDFYKLNGRSHAAALFGAFARMSHPFIGLSNDFAPILAFTVFLLIGLGWYLDSRIHLYLSVILSVLLVLTFSRGVLLAVGLAGAVLAVYLFRTRILRTRHVVRFCIAAALVFALVALVVSRYNVSSGQRDETLLHVVVHDRTSAANIDSRMKKYQGTLNQIKNRPFWGLGGGNFSATGQKEKVMAAHDTYLQNFVFFGLVFGSIVNICYLLMFLRLKALLADNQPRRIFFSFCALGFLMILIAAATETFMEATVPRILVFFILGLFFATANCLPSVSEV